MENTDELFDVIVVGAGTGGSTAARVAADQGLKVCLIDSKEREKIGDKICGDAVGTEIFEFLDIDPPQGEELSCHVQGGKLYSPDLKNCMTLVDPKQAGFIVHRLEFGQRLLNEALEAGVHTFLDKTRAYDLTYDNNNVNGIKVRLSNGEKTDIHGKIVIDASGYYSPLRKKIISDIIEKEIPDEDAILCYREIVEFPEKDQEVIDKSYITIILDQQRAPGGYVWYFPKDDNSVNIGLGVYMHYKGKVKEFYKRNVYDEFIKTDNVKIISSGGGVVPVRRPIWSCADNGIMFIGDAACQVNPLHGGGIDPSMRAGYYAANAAIKAINVDDYSIDTLWSYNHNVMTTFGAEYASLDLLRIVLQRLSNNSLNFGLGKDLLTSSEILDICSTGHIKLSFFDMATKALKGITNPGLMLDLNYLRIRMNEISDHYRKFPKDRKEFEKWKQETIKIYDKIHNVSFK